MAGKIKKGTLVRAVKEKLAESIEATASDNRFPDYIFESKGEILEIDGDYALVKFYVPTPNIWFNLELLEVL
ncbi:MAG: NAD(P)H-quinone oxidoreductase subunit O [Cyanobacteria bacterium P01_F01_bin.143]